jgi:hypothetical protein
VVASVVALPVALVFAAAEAVAEAVAVLLVAVPVGVAVAVAVLVAVVPSLGLVLLLAGLALVLLGGGLVAVAAGATLGLADPLVLFEGDGEELDWHTIAFGLGALLEMLLAPKPLADEDIGLPAPATPWDPLLLWEANPTAVPSWMKAWRSGVNARTTPMANTTQAAARADRSSPSCQSRG